MSGKGKSVFMQDLARSIVSKGGRVFVIDVGRSFERQVKHFEGQFVEFKSGSNLCLNPFSNINSKKQDDIDDQLAILKPIIAMMIAPKAGTTDHEDSLISEAITRVWNEKGNEAGMGDIADWFLEKEEGEEYKRMGRQLFNYGRDGVYGKYFNGKANINFYSNLKNVLPRYQKGCYYYWIAYSFY